MRPVATHVAWSVCLFVTTVSPTKTDERIQQTHRDGGGAKVRCMEVHIGSSHWKLSQELKEKYAAFFAKYICVEMATRKIQTYENKAKNLCSIYFVHDLDGKCIFIKTKHYSD